MFVSMIAFAVKAGMGWAYLWSKCPRGRKIAASTLVLAGYAAIFTVVTFVVSRVNLIANYELFAPLWSSGVTLHWITAVFIFVWGLVLLKSSPGVNCHTDETSKAWLALVIPCPVCLSVVLVSASCLALYFPNDSTIAMVCLYTAFTLVAAISGIAVLLGKKLKPENSVPAEETLGQAMILIAAYFIISALVMPQFAEISKIYRLAAYSSDGQTSDSATGWLVLAIIALLLCIGFVYAKWQTSISKNLENTD
jgi:predicted transporter